jgi:sec-independent protein translocase protein TatA
MSLSIWHVILVLVVVLIIFGAGKLPRVMGDVAKGIKNFKAGISDPGDTPTTVEPPPVAQQRPVPGDTKTHKDSATKS